MKKLAISVALCTLLGTSFASHASLTASADGKTVYDSELKLTWLADANYSQTSGYHSSGNMNWDDANNGWAGNLNFAGHSDWRLPTIGEITELRHELGGSTGSLFNNHNSNFNLFTNFSNDWYWTSTGDSNDATKATAYHLNLGAPNVADVNNGYRAMAVSAVPEPETYAMLLAGLGLIGAMTRRRKQIS